MRIFSRHELSRKGVRTLSAAAVVSLVSTGLIGSVTKPKTVVEEHMTDLSAEATKLSMTRGIRQVDTGISTEMVGFDWPGRSGATIEVRSLTAGVWSDWMAVDGNQADGPDTTSREYHQRVPAGPVWIGRGVKTIQVRVKSGFVSGLRIHAIRTETTGGSGIPAASAAVAQPGIITRAQWGADESWRAHNAGCGTPSYADNVQFVVVHHTVQTNNYGPGDSAAMVRGDYFFHVFDNGWCDIGYNFLVDRYGQIFEGRFGGMNRAVIGAHAGGFNTGSTGIALIGTFDTSYPTPAMYNSLVSLIAWKSAYHQIDPHGSVTVTAGNFPSSRWPPGTIVSIPTVIGHRDVDMTDCPGQLMYALMAQLRNDVAATLGSEGAPKLQDARLTCDWTGTGVSTPAIYSAGVFYIRQTNAPGPADLMIPFGNPGDTPVCGDWMGTGVQTIGIFRGGAWYLRNSNTPGPADVAFTYGNPGDVPIVGRWTGSRDRPGVYRSGLWFLRNSLTTGASDINFVYGNPTDLPIVGNWSGGTMDTPGVVRNGIWYLRYSNDGGFANASLAFGNPGDQPLAGRWTGGKADTPGVSRGGIWFLRDSLSSGGADQSVLF